MNSFVLAGEEYQRNINFLEAYRRDMATYLQLQTGKSYEVCLSFVNKAIGEGGEFEMKDPDVLCLTKHKPGHRNDEVIKLTEFFSDVVSNQRLLSPTLAVYINPKEKRSVLAKYIAGNIQRRSTAKHEMFAAKASNNDALYTFKDIQQTSFKLKNNSLSGAHSSPFTTLFLKSAHSTLTSTCRSASGYGNANNEKFIMGNRHYWSPDVVKANIVSIINNSNYELIARAMAVYGIRPPTVAETMKCITYSTGLYWRNPMQLEVIEHAVSKLTEMQRAAFVYTGDMYHLAILNDSVMREFLDALSTKATVGIEDPDTWIKAMDADMKAFVSMLCGDILQGVDIKEIAKTNPAGYAIIAATAKHVLSVLDKYALLIQALWTTPNVPASVASLPNCIRRTAITSDTDSTIFTVQWWVEWYSGKINFTQKSCAVRDSVVYLASQSIIHLLALMTANMGVIPEQRFQLAMKNEYCFPVFSLTSRSKHYFAYMGAREGLVFKELELELKGVALKNSNCPPEVMRQLRKLITDVMDTVMAGELISIYEVMGRIAKVENEIKASILGGKYEYLNTTQIKTRESYKTPDSSNYSYYTMWEEVFASKYGHTEAPTYSAIKVSVDADNPTKLKEWLLRMPDQAIAGKLKDWLDKNNKVTMSTMLLPEIVCGVAGVPQEVVCGIDIRKLIYATTSSFYLILEALGFYMQDGNLTRLVSDYEFLSDIQPIN